MATRVTRQAPPHAGLDAATAAWLAVPPTAILVLLAMLVLGPPLGELLAPSAPARFWIEVSWLVHPEPTEQARYLIALAAPLVLSGLTLLGTHHATAVPAVMAKRLVLGIQAATAGVLVVCLVLQRNAVYSPLESYTPRVVYFTIATLAVALMLALLVVVVIRRPALTRRLTRWAADSRPYARAATLIAIVAVVVTVLPAIVPETSAPTLREDVAFHLRFTYDETAAVLNGRSPLGDFAAQYASLLPYLFALVVAPFGASIGAFTVALAVLTAAAMLALFAVLHRVTRSPLVALALFLPLLATSAFFLHGTSRQHFSVINYFGTMPLRYAGPFLLAWLVARHLDGARPRRAWALFTAAGLVALNNADFGFPALGATIAALLWCAPPTTVRLRRLAIDLALGLAAAVALVAVLLLVRAGALPDLSLLLRYAQLFGRSGFAMLPVHPLIGLSTIVYLTYVAAVGAATVLTLRGGDRLLAGMLAWSGIFGLGAGGYYVGRSIAETLTNMFPAWALAVSLLTFLVVRELVTRGGRRLRPAELVCLFLFGLLVCSLPQTASPIEQVSRITSDGPHLFRQPNGERFVAEHTTAGEPIALLTPLGHRIADRVGVTDVAPYSGSESVQTEEQLDDTLSALHKAGGTKVVFALPVKIASGLRDAIAARGLRLADTTADGSFELWLLP